MPDNDPYAAYGGSVETQTQPPVNDPYAAYGGSVEKTAASSNDTTPAAPGWRDQLTGRINDPSNTPDTGWRGEVEKFGQGAAQGLNAVLLHPVQTAMAAGRQIMAAGATGEPGVPTTAMTGNPTIDAQNEQAREDARADAAEQGRQMAANPANTLGQVAGGAIATHALSAIPKVVSAAVRAPAPVPGENFTPQQHASFSGVLARGIGAGKGYFPKDIATSIGSAVRQAAADNPSITSTITAGSPEDSLAGTQALLGKVREGIDVQHQQALQPVANTPIDPSRIQSAVNFPQSLNDFAPADAAAVRDLRARLGSVRTLGGLNDLRMYLNRELASQFRQNPVAAGNSGAFTAAMQDALKAARDQYYQELEKATGQDFQGVKRMESSVLSAEEALGNAAPGLAAKQAIAEQPRSVRGNLANVIQGANTIKGGPVAGATQFIANRVLGETPMTPVQEGLQHFFRDLPEPTPPTVLGPQISQGPSTPNPRSPIVATPAQIPAQTLGEAPPAQAPQSLRERLAGSYGAVEPNQFPPVYQEPAIPTAGPVPDRGTIVVGPDGVARRGPAGALPERTGAPLQLGAGAGNPEFVTPQPSPPQPLNAAIARTNVNAGRPRPVQEAIPQRTISVSPEGQAAIQRPALPAPETHSFDPQQWQQAHPNGNLKAAILKAQKAGYKIVDTGQEVARVAPRSQAQSTASETPAAPKLTPQDRVLIRPGNGRTLDDSTAKAYLAQAGGDKEKARQAAAKDGWRIGK